MSNYSNKPQMCRCDFFKESGKWYGTVEFEWLYYDKSMSIHDAFYRSLHACCNGHYTGMTAVCLEPYHELAHPVMLHNWNEYKPSPLKLS